MPNDTRWVEEIKLKAVGTAYVDLINQVLGKYTVTRFINPKQKKLGHEIVFMNIPESEKMYLEALLVTEEELLERQENESRNN